MYAHTTNCHWSTLLIDSSHGFDRVLVGNACTGSNPAEVVFFYFLARFLEINRRAIFVKPFPLVDAAQATRGPRDVRGLELGMAVVGRNCGGN